MRYAEYAPPAPLRDAVRCFWILEGQADGEPERILPDGCVEIVVEWGEPMRREGERGPVVHAVAAGQQRRALHLTGQGQVGMVGARFHPWGAAPFLDTRLRELTDQVLPLDELWRDAGELAERLAAIDDDATRVGLLARRLLVAREAARLCVSPEVQDAVHRIRKERGALPVSALARGLGWSTRRLERRFAEQVGLAPKVLGRVERFQHVLRRLDGPGAVDLAALALEAGYADQSHLSREFRALAGTTVRRYQAEQHALADCFLHGGQDDEPGPRDAAPR